MSSARPPFSSATASEILASVDQSVRKDFEANRRLLSFEEYLLFLAEHAEKQVRGSAQYAAEMMEHAGRDGARFKVFDEPVDGQATRVVGHEAVQGAIYRAFKAFSRQHFNNRLVLLHGPNGSAKTSIIHALMGGLERYSHQAEGALYTFNWIFPVERYTKGGMGLNAAYATAKDSKGSSGERLNSFAKLADEDVSARIACDLRDHPLLIIPSEQRFAFVEKLIGHDRATKLWENAPLYLTRGDLCHRCKQIAESLLAANAGDFRRVLAHVQVERFYLTRRYRKGLVTIEPQMHVDAQAQQLTMNRSIGNLPVSLQSLNLFSVTGDLVDGSRGLVEYSDLLKRPVDTFKYLLTACETGFVNIGNSIAYLDTLLLGSANEVQLDAFKEFPDFTSFKARIELIRVPYLLDVSQEVEIYQPQMKQIAGDKHVAPHTAWTTALWSVLTRLKKPNSINYPPSLSSIMSSLTPLEKAKLYDQNEVPASLPAEDKKLLRASVRKLREEYNNVPYYEGRMGASAREMKSILFDAAQNAEFACLSPLAVLRQIEEFVKRISEYEFLKQDVKDGFHDAAEFINTTRNEYLNRIDRDVRDSVGIYDTVQWEEFLKRYVGHVSLVLKKEKARNPITGKAEEPDQSLIAEFEKIVEAPEDSVARETFRQNIISQIGAWSLDHPGEPVVYAKVFPEYWRRLEKHYFESQKALLTQMHDAVLIYGTTQDDPNSEGGKLARKTINNMVARQGYCAHCAKEVISFLMKQRY